MSEAPPLRLVSSSDAVACENCKFFSPEKLNPKMGACRKNPPVPFQLLIPAARNPLAMNAPQGVEVRYQGAWPPVQRENWCGAFERKCDA